MFASDRRKQIEQLVNEQKQMDVSELSDLFDVSEVTIRKDLNLLEDSGKLIRTYGGAISMEQAFSSAEESAAPESENDVHMIAHLMAHMVQEGDLIYLGCDSICTDAARLLKDKENLNVITNNITAASILVENQNIRIGTPPGQLQKTLNNHILLGTETEVYLSEKSVDKALLAVDSIKMDGFGIQDVLVCKAYQQILANADTVLIAAKSDVFDRNAIAQLGDLTIAGKIIGDERMPENYISYFYKMGIEVYNSYNIKEISQ